MFSDNRKISKRQVHRLFIYDITGVSTLLLPPLLAKTAGRDGIFCIFLALIPAYLFLTLIDRVSKRSKKEYSAYMRESFGTVISSAALCIYFILSIVLAGYVLYVLSCLIKTSLLKDESYWLICLCILALGGYGIMGGIEGRARIYEILFWFLMAPLLLMLLLAARDVNADYWTPVFTSGVAGVLKGTLLVFVFYSVIYVCHFLVPFEKKKGGAVRAAKSALFVSALLNAAVYLITLGMFATNALSNMEYPIITLMSMIKLPGGFFERQDAFMVAIWFFTMYALINSGMFYGTEVLKSLFHQKGEKRYVLVTVILTFAAAALFYRSEAALMFCRKYLICAGLVFLLAVPILLLCFGKKQARAKGGDLS